MVIIVSTALPTEPRSDLLFIINFFCNIGEFSMTETFEIEVNINWKKIIALF